MEERAEIVVFGATGFTGERVAKYLMKCMSLRSGTSWAIAGRSKQKLEHVIELLKKEESDGNVVLPRVILADCKDEKSLSEMCRQAKILINCVGPYRFFGEPVVRACVEAKTHYLDVTGEPEFMERMVLKYHEKASKNGVLVVSACGFDSIPADLGVAFILREFKEKNVTAVNIKSILEVQSGPKGMAIHYATYESAVHGVGSIEDLKTIRKELSSKSGKFKPSTIGKPLKLSILPEFDPAVSKWIIPFPGADASVVKRSLTSRAKENPEEAFPRYYATFSFSSTLWMVLGLMLGFVFRLFASFESGRNILLKFPGLFSLGLISHEGPSEEQMKQTSFSFKFFAEGIKNSSISAGNTSTCDSKMSALVRGPEPGYVATPICVVQSAFVVLDEIAKFPVQGGVLSPGAVFYNTSLIDRLDKEGVSFRVLSTE